MRTAARSAAEVDAELRAIDEQGAAATLSTAVNTWTHELRTVAGHVRECLEEASRFTLARHPELAARRRLLLDECGRVGAMAHDKQEGEP
jgi:hypothetical protein